jgi:hypothetical protein
MRPGPAPWTVRAGLAAAFALAAACSGGPEKAMREAAESARSWAAAARVAADAWTAHRVGRGYARAALEAAQRGLEEERSTLAASPANLADARVSATAQDIGRLSALVATMGESVRNDDAAGLETAKAALVSTASRLGDAPSGAPR